jgi:hypothetical protein
VRAVAPFVRSGNTIDEHQPLVERRIVQYEPC